MGISTSSLQIVSLLKSKTLGFRQEERMAEPTTAALGNVSAFSPPVVPKVPTGGSGP